MKFTKKFAKKLKVNDIFHPLKSFLRTKDNFDSFKNKQCKSCFQVVFIALHVILCENVEETK